uniref:Competence protein CoiA nuclease-like domain-containing protein n=1 Tax=viral metagenome TaxID=1070528 RepID=A0A6M3XY29_9ZZZZ
MTSYDVIRKRNKAIDLIDRRTLQQNKKNLIKIGANESLTHAQKKVEFCHYLLQKGKQYYTECFFTNGKGRADIFLLDDLIAVEIMDSETESKILEKKLKYPCMVIEVRMNQTPKEIFGD